MISRNKTLGLSPKSRVTWSNRKSRWRKRVRRLLRTLDDLVASANKGRHVPMGDIYVLARAIADAGQRGMDLRATMPTELRRPGLPAKSIAGLCIVLESASHVLRDLTERQNTPLVEFPMFTNSLADPGLIYDTGALEALDDLRKAVES